MSVNTDPSLKSFSLDLSASMHSNPVTPPSKKLASLRIALQAKTTELDALRAQWETARADILGQNAILEDRANALNRELEAAKAETKKMLASGRRKADEQAAERINVEAVSVPHSRIPKPLRSMFLRNLQRQSL